MNRITVVLSPEPTRVRMLVRRGRRDVLKAVLGPAEQAHPRAASTLLGGIGAMASASVRRCIVCGRACRVACALGLCNALGFGEQNVHYEVGRGVRRGGRRVAASTITGIGELSRSASILTWPRVTR